MESDPYKILGVRENASLDEVRAAYRRMTARHHPKAGGDSEVQQRIDSAYKAICNGYRAITPLQPPSIFPELPRSDFPVSAPLKPVIKSPSRARIFGNAVRTRLPWDWIAAGLGTIAGVCFVWWILSMILWGGTKSDGTIASNGSSEPSAASNQGTDSSRAGTVPASDSGEKGSSNSSPPPDGSDHAPGNQNNKPTNQLPGPSTPESTDPDRNLPDQTGNSTTPQPKQGNGSDNCWDIPIAGIRHAVSQFASLEWDRWVPKSQTNNGPDNPLFKLPEFPAPVRPGNGALSKQAYREVEKATIAVDKIVAFYMSELTRTDLDDSSRFFIEGRLAELKANSGKLLIEDRYLTMQGVSDVRQHSIVLLQRWFHQVNALDGDLDSREYREANKLIAEAEKTDPVSFQASFYLGLVNVFVTRDFEKATGYFEKCVERGRRYGPLLDQTDRENLARAMHNLGILKIRNNYNINKACQLWAESLDYRSPSSELMANVLRVDALIGRGYLRPDSDGHREFVDWRTELQNKHPGRAGGNHRGWAYEPWQADASRKMPDLGGATDELLKVVSGDTELVDSVCLECSGVGSLNCTGTGCVRGQVKKTRYVPRQFGNTVVQVSEPYWITCPTCSGRGRLDCQGCNDGVQNF